MDHPLGNDATLRSRIIEFFSENISPRLVELTTPVFQPDAHRRPELVGSSIVIQIGPQRMLVTATHVTDLGHAAPLAINVGDEVVPLRGEMTAIYSQGAGPGSEGDHYDVTIVRLEDDLASRISSRNVALLTDLDLTFPRADSGPHLLVGYPCSRNRTSLKGDTFTAHAYTLLLHDGDVAFYASVGVSSDGQFAAAADRKDVWSAEGKAMAPDPYGISGGGLWKLPLDEQATVADARLAAIAVEWHQKAVPKHLLGTRIRSVLTALHDRYADLRPHIDEAVRVA